MLGHLILAHLILGYYLFLGHLILGQQLILLGTLDLWESSHYPREYQLKGHLSNPRNNFPGPLLSVPFHTTRPVIPLILLKKFHHYYNALLHFIDIWVPVVQPINTRTEAKKVQRETDMPRFFVAILTHFLYFYFINSKFKNLRLIENTYF